MNKTMRLIRRHCCKPGKSAFSPSPGFVIRLLKSPTQPILILYQQSKIKSIPLLVHRQNSTTMRKLMKLEGLQNFEVLKCFNFQQLIIAIKPASIFPYHINWTIFVAMKRINSRWNSLLHFSLIHLYTEMSFEKNVPVLFSFTGKVLNGNGVMKTSVQEKISLWNDAPLLLA